VCTGRKEEEEEGGRGCVIERMCAWILFFLSLLVCSPVSHKGRQDMGGHEEIVSVSSCLFVSCVESVVALLNF
jgi:hypothetical protein